MWSDTHQPPLLGQNPHVFGDSPFKMEMMMEIDKIKTWVPEAITVISDLTKVNLSWKKIIIFLIWILLIESNLILEYIILQK